MNVLGLDLLGLANKNVDMKAVIRAFPQGFAIGVFAREFGDVIPNLKKLLDTGKVSAVRVQLWWGGKPHVIAPMKFLEKEAPRWEALANEYPHIQFFVSHSCEYSEDDISAIARRVDLIQLLCPSCILVQSPMKSPIIKGVGLLEEHGTKATTKAQIVSADGICSADINTPKWLAKHVGALIRFLHAPRFNLQHHVKFPITLPPAPKRKAAPSAEYITHIVRQAVPEPNYDVQAYFGPEKTTRPKKPNLWKTVAEDSNSGANLVDPRGTKPMYFFKRRKNKKTGKWKESPEFLEIVNRDGNVLGRLKLHLDEDEDPNRTTDRYYAGGKNAINAHGFQIADLAVMTSSSPYIGIKVGKKVHWPIHGALRTPFYQKQK
jgi:hypothetical protein